MAKSKNMKKEWYPIVAPKLFRNAVLGETAVYDPEHMIGKNVTTNLMSLTNEAKKQNIKVKFEVGKVHEGKAQADMVGYQMVNASVKRLVRRNIDKIELSFTCKTADEKTVRLKPLIITRTQTNGLVGTKIRKEAQAFLKQYVSKIKYENMTNDLVYNKMQEALKAHLKKVHPIRICAMKSMILGKATQPEEKVEKPAEAQ